MTNEDRVIVLIQRELDLPEGTVTTDTTNADVESWDSLGHLRICMALEAEFGRSFELEQLGELTSVERIVAALRS
jgi:acyl carrier protein